MIQNIREMELRREGESPFEALRQAGSGTALCCTSCISKTGHSRQVYKFPADIDCAARLVVWFHTCLPATGRGKCRFGT
jgi:hypothetical protein